MLENTNAYSRPGTRRRTRPSIDTSSSMTTETTMNNNEVTTSPIMIPVVNELKKNHIDTDIDQIFEFEEDINSFNSLTDTIPVPRRRRNAVGDTTPDSVVRVDTIPTPDSVVRVDTIPTEDDFISIIGKLIEYIKINKKVLSKDLYIIYNITDRSDILLFTGALQRCNNIKYSVIKGKATFKYIDDLNTKEG